MVRSRLKFEFDQNVETRDIEDLVAVATTAVEGLCGRTAMRIDPSIHIATGRRSIEIDDRTDVGRCLARVLTRLAERGIGPSDFHVHRVTANNEYENGEV
ncbi:MAG: hypothetical protein KF757_14035 [Phycisphaeraceae bacterium]|nr:hypothetical protein [Phycisphaeraceae bacterium]MCW5763632.1 hypothetical protein [Phycisphaeraceae bacterium]